jgi:DNA-binding HxlR family transcriptional regulator
MAANKTFLFLSDTVKPVRDTMNVINGKWKLPIIIFIGVGNTSVAQPVHKARY